MGFWWRKSSWKRGFKGGGEGTAGEEWRWESWKKGFGGGGFGRRRGRASFSAIGAETRWGVESKRRGFANVVVALAVKLPLVHLHLSKKSFPSQGTLHSWYTRKSEYFEPCQFLVK